MNRLIAIGDIHGHLGKLERLLITVQPTPEDQFVFLGDYIDRGPESPGVIDYLLHFSKRVPCIFLRGNHEDMLIKYVDFGYDTFLHNGGLETLGQYGRSVYGGIPEQHLSFFRSLHPYYETDDFIFVHAGLKPSVALADQATETLVWGDDEFFERRYNSWGKTIVFGHSPQPEPIMGAERICLDTGVCFPAHSGFGRLTCCEVRSRTFYSV